MHHASQAVQLQTYEQASKGAEGVAALIGKAEDLSKAMGQSLKMTVRGQPQCMPTPGMLGCDTDRQSLLLSEHQLPPPCVLISRLCNKFSSHSFGV